MMTRDAVQSLERESDTRLFVNQWTRDFGEREKLDPSITSGLYVGKKLKKGLNVNRLTVVEQTVKARWFQCGTAFF